MQKLLKELKTTLEQEIDLHLGLKADLAYEAEQDGELSGGDYLRLQQRKYIWAGQIEEIETRRVAQVNELAEKWEADEKKMSLREIIDRVADPFKESFRDSRETLIALVEEIRNLARKTGANAQARLKAIDATLSVIGEAARQHPTYSEEGRIQQRPPTFKSTSA